jgi:putative hydrolase of the HAD superfamily
VIRGVLLDVGDTLTTPIGGRWNPRFDFESTLASFGASYDTAMLPAAIAAGDACLAWMAAGGDRDDYHRAILSVLGVAASPELLSALDRPLPFSQVIEVFADVRPALITLKEWGLAMAIVSDTGAGARKTYEELEWTDFFSAYAISAELGCCKPDPRMYRTASEALGLEPPECLFVDNDADCVQGALALGYHACGISRYGEPPDDGLDWIRSMDDLLELVPVLSNG